MNLKKKFRTLHLQKKKIILFSKLSRFNARNRPESSKEFRLANKAQKICSGASASNKTIRYLSAWQTYIY